MGDFMGTKSGTQLGTTTEETFSSRLAVLLRPDRSVQFGIHPRQAFVLPLPQAVDPAQVLHALLQTRAGVPRAELARVLTYCGFEPYAAAGVVEELIRANVLVPGWQRRTLPVLSTGRPALAVAEALDPHNIDTVWVDQPTMATSHIVAGQATSAGRTVASDVLLLAGSLFPTPDVQFWLQEQQVTHYPIGMLDGRLVFGPLIIPGLTPCLNCVDKHYLDQDLLWRATRTQATARPSGSTAFEHELLAKMAATIITDHLLPWRDAGMDPRRIPEFLRHRHILDPGCLAMRVEAFDSDPSCIMCDLAAQGAPPPPVTQSLQ